jgi:hypothetical protein
VSTRTVGRVTAALAALAVVLSLAACTKSTPGQHVTISTGANSSQSSSIPTIQQTGPISGGPVTEKTASTCPFLGFDTAKNDSGMRLDRIATLSQGGKVVGCRIYALQHPNSQCDATCLGNEHLPPASVPAIEILLSKYANTTNAHNAFIRIAEAGTNFQQTQIATGNTGLCYQTTLWSKDAGKDSACTFSKGTTVVVIRTVVVGSPLNVVEIAKAVYPKV